MHRVSARWLPGRWRRLFALLSIAVAVVTLPMSAATAAAATTTLRNFDAVTTVERQNVWYHMALIGDKYVIFNDRGIIEGPQLIRLKWPFLPERFTHDVDSAGIAFSRSGYYWRHTWTKGNEVIVFEDAGIIPGQQFLPQSYDGISDFNNSTTTYFPISHMVVKGGNFAFFNDTNYAVTSGSISREFPFLPEYYTYGLDDISVEREPSGSLNYSFYKGNERLIFQDGRIIELVRLDLKWPFLNPLRQQRKIVGH
ncbi:hypothetical protein KRM28CT15_26530 [Krasilnikovia sp. M28-CT-15]